MPSCHVLVECGFSLFSESRSSNPPPGKALVSHGEPALATIVQCPPNQRSWNRELSVLSPPSSLFSSFVTSSVRISKHSHSASWKLDNACARALTLHSHPPHMDCPTSYLSKAAECRACRMRLTASGPTARWLEIQVLDFPLCPATSAPRSARAACRANSAILSSNARDPMATSTTSLRRLVR